MADALPPPPPAIVITGTALPEAKANRVYATEQISARRIRQAPSHELDQILKDVPGVQLFRRSDSRSGHPTSQGVTLRALGGNASSRALLVLDGVPQSDPFGDALDPLRAFDGTCRVNPPLPSREDGLALLGGVADGTIDAIATDHAPHPPERTLVEFPDAAPGMIGLETAVLYESPAERERARRLEAGLYEQERPEPVTVRYRRKSGEGFPAETVASVLRDQDGQFIGLIKLVRDISKQVVPQSAFSPA